MPQNRKRKPRKTPINRASNTHHPPPTLSQPKGERQEMTGNDGETKISILSSRQQGALPIIAAAPSLSRAAGAAGVGENTLRRWLREPVDRNIKLT